MSPVLWALVGFALFEFAGNAAILGAHVVARRRHRPLPAPWGLGTEHAHEVTDRIWRSGRPSSDTYRAVAEAGVRTVIDLRAEGGHGPDDDLPFERMRHPIRDGQPPDPETITALRIALDGATSPVLIHCSAGVGRTGSSVAALLVLDEGWEAGAALWTMLAVGPPSLEQIDFVAGLPHRLRPRWWTVVVSRTLDAPRRTWSRLRQTAHLQGR